VFATEGEEAVIAELVVAFDAVEVEQVPLGAVVIGIDVRTRGSDALTAR
jgi:hypothetical protein